MPAVEGGMGGDHHGRYFKPRKIPKHLIIQDNYEIRRKPRANLLRWVFWFVLLLVGTGLALEMSYLNGF